MASQQAVKHRIKSVSNTKQITKAMQLVAASKLRRAQEAALGPKSYITTARAILVTMAGHPGALLNPLFKTPNTPNVLTIVIASDRGLAGAYNANILKASVVALKEQPDHNEVITVGKYATRFITRLKDVNLQGAYELDADHLAEQVVTPLLAKAIGEFSAGAICKVQVVYTKFISTVKQEVVTETLLPIQAMNDTVQDRLFEPNVEQVFDYAMTRMLEAEVLQYLLESRASEHASRMLAMKNATDNANELIDDLTLVYNNARQAKITQELAEISAGAEAIQ